MIMALILVCGQNTGFQHTFVFESDRSLKSVSVAGTFNGWNKDANPMRQNGKRWVATVQLPLGKIQYKYVLDGENWVLDPQVGKIDDGNGNTNSAFVNIPDDFRMPARKGDGKISSFGVRHSGNVPDVSRQAGQWTIRLHVRANDVENVDCLANGAAYRMREVATDGFITTLQADVPAKGDSLSYSFALNDGPAHVPFSAGGFDQPVPEFVAKSADLAQPKLPDWVGKTVVYQIFPDRFENGDAGNDPQDVQPWSAEPTWYNHFGGDAAGVAKRTPYLKDLGVGAIYFNPVFASPANHRYETSDYFKIDPAIGTNSEFRKLVSKLHSNGIKVVLDGVFNHTATNFFAFKDVASAGPSSRYKDWYFVKGYPVDTTGPKPNYEAWAGFGSMPKLNVANPEVRKYLLGVPAFWDKELNLDGWRLDVPDQVSSDFWPEFRKVVKSDNPNRWIVGEIWSDGSPWLKGDMFDSVMGYQFRQNTVDFIAEGKTKAGEYANRMMEVYTSYAPAVAGNLMNLLSSHDTERFFTLCKEDAGLAKLGAFLQFTWPGTPSVYYGEELGMAGGKDPLNRRPMAWNRVEGNAMLGFYKSLIHLRNTLPVLQSGEPVVLATDDQNETLAFARTMGHEFAIAALNRSTSTQTISLDLSALAEGQATLHENLMNIFGNGTTSVGPSGRLVVSLPARGVCLLATRRNSSMSYQGVPETSLACN